MMFQRLIQTPRRLTPITRSVTRTINNSSRAFGTQSKLPEGWVEYKDPSDGSPYYYNSATQATQWDRPGAPAPPAPPAASASSSTSKLPWETDVPKTEGSKLPWETDGPKAKLPWETDAPKTGAAKLPWETDAPKTGAAKLPWETDAPKTGAAKLPWETDAPKSLADQKLPWEENTESTQGSRDDSSRGQDSMFRKRDGQNRNDRFGGEPRNDRSGDRSENRFGDRNENRFGDRNENRFGSEEEPRSRLNDSMDPSNFSLTEINWASENLETTNKSYYKTSQAVSSRTEEDVRAMLKKEGVTIKGSNPLPRPFQTFEEAWGNHPDLLKVCTKKKYTEPTLIQKIGWSVALSGRDMIGLAQTGSGKTMAFALPAAAHCHAQPPRKPREGPLALIICPTRELAQQIENDLEDFEDCGLNSLAVYGGKSKRYQVQQLQRGVDIIVATPGRLLDLLSTGVTNLKRVGYLVLDEADRMLDMGFEPQIRKIITQIRPDRQTQFWSATWPREVEQLARDLCTGNAPVQIQVGGSELQANGNIKQEIVVSAESEKQHAFFDWCDKNLTEDKKCLVFSGTKRDCDNLARRIESKTRRTARSIHSGKTQPERDQVLHEFRSSQTRVIVATDVAQRGLDISDIDYVVNYDCPKSIEDYIHRIGRTGRAGRTGTSVTFMTSYRSVENRRMAKSISKAMRDVGQTPPDELLDLC